MIGAQALIRTLVDAGVTVCFTNPGTSEMHFVAALDEVPEMRAVLALFEGVATGAADGYARMSDAPGATLLHLGPGLGNGLANLHNARRAKVPIVNIVGDHATYHTQYDAPLQSDIETVARNVSPWVRTSRRTEDIAADAVDAVVAAHGPPGQVATLILPADVSWGDGAEPLRVPEYDVSLPTATEDTVEAVAEALKRDGATALLLGGSALRERGLLAAGRIAAVTGARLLGVVFPTRLQRGAGLPAVERIPYFPDAARARLEELEQLVLVDAKPPASFFAYPGKRSYLAPDGCEVRELASSETDAIASLEALVEALGAAAATPQLARAFRPQPPTGTLDAEKVARAIGSVLPERAIVCEEAITSALPLPANTAGAPPHDWLTLTGGAIGEGLPLAVGAAVARPDRPVFALQADGSGLYTIQSLWTMAREQLDVTVVIFNNRSYRILKVELERVGAQPAGPKADAQFDLGHPEINFVDLAAGFGVPGRRAETGEEMTEALQDAAAEPGPHLIDAVIG